MNACTAFRLLIIGIVLSWAMPVGAADAPLRPQEDSKGFFTFALENDFFVGQDEGYTSGVRLGWLSSETNMPDWVRNIAQYTPADPESHKRIGVAIGQSFFTPKDKLRSTYNPDDRPYAAWLYASLGVIADTGRTVDTYQVTLGMVGPSALGRQTQDAVHDLIGDKRTNGWDHQLKDELGVVLTYNKKWKSFYEHHPIGLSFDGTPHVGFNLGNVYTNAMTGIVFRLGENLPNDYGPPEIQPSLAGSGFFIPTPSLGWYLFAGVNGQVVGRNIFLDGNTFRDGPNVNKKFLVGSATLGAAVTYGATRLAYNYALRTKEFEGETAKNNFGAITLSYRF